MSNTVLQIRNNGQITLPTSIRRKSNLKAGDLLFVTIEEDGSIRLVPQVAIDRSQAYFWTRRWQEGERQAEEDIQAGKVHEFNNVDEAIDFLDKRDKKG
jgi:AbrB family looped-hinge helix DNA binding protein